MRVIAQARIVAVSWADRDSEQDGTRRRDYRGQFGKCGA
jgi:hypothetical protein